MARLNRLLRYEDFRAAARRRLPAILFDYIDGGSYGEVTLARNAQAFSNAVLEPRILIDVEAVDSTVTVFGTALSMPLVLAPVGFAGMYARRGEVQAARAARTAGLAFTLSTVGICPIDEVSRGAGTPPWFQLYMIRDRGWMKALLLRASAAGCPALILTADLQTPGARYRDQRSGMAQTPSLFGHMARAAAGLSRPDWLFDVMLAGGPHTFGNLDGVLPKAAAFDEAWRWIAANFDPRVTWRDLDFIRQHWSGPLILKGVMGPQDADLACQHGLDGMVVSNHGGRQLDAAPATLDVLPAIVETVAGRAPVLLDGGVRSGLDILKAMKQGASAVMIGKAWAFALAAGGEAGVSALLTRLRAELETAQRLSATLSFKP